MAKKHFQYIAVIEAFLLNLMTLDESVAFSFNLSQSKAQYFRINKLYFSCLL